jgi:hypothetical protein
LVDRIYPSKEKVVEGVKQLKTIKAHNLAHTKYDKKEDDQNEVRVSLAPSHKGRL